MDNCCLIFVMMTRRLPRTRVGTTRIQFYILATFVISGLVLYKSFLATLSVQIIIGTSIASETQHTNVKRSVDTSNEPEDTAFIAVSERGTVKWQKITQRNELVIFSAYYNKDSSEGEAIQSIVLKREPDPDKVDEGPRIEELYLTCLLLFTSGKEGFYRSVSTRASPLHIWDGHHHKRYRPGYVYCKLPNGDLPAALSITSGGRTPLNQVKILYQQLPKTPVTFTLCLSPLHFKSNIDRTLVQYFELNKLLGAEQFFVYNMYVNKQTKPVLNYYSKKNYTKIIPWNLPSYLQREDDIWYFAQTVALNDCYLRNKGRTKYLITTDLDEFILPKKVSESTWNDMLVGIPSHCAYEFQCVVIDMTQKNSVIKNEHRMKMSQILGLFTLTYQNRHNYILPSRLKSKMIVKTDCFDGINVHGPMASISTNKPMTVAPGKAVMFHYANPEAKFLDKQNEGDLDLEKILMPYAADLIRSTSSVWRSIRTH